MKKIFLAVILLSILIVISYMKMERAEKREAESYEKGKNAGNSLAMKEKEQGDSVLKSLNSKILTIEDSLAGNKLEMSKLSDSLNDIIQAQDKTILSIIQDNEKLRASTIVSKKNKISKSKSNHHEILAHYKKRIDHLPKDLSKYEQRIAIDEIRQETAGKFSISMIRFNKIRKDNNIDY